ncbi:beta-glucosidase [Curtobacterium sp. MCBD17_013]|uniref:GH1 family beta-glucosidase n=1 Tax=unclassified Curtobacterium TaxID=257496 RepID=UPI000DA7365C|nr:MULTISPECIES: GH1 family beta-glucosidase [unclassified Curtobacterium]PZE73525.1 beta-glucosidase [Curtobacterium sp. MCBD17_019]PZF60544.1 beta-glucosidase [Curtobacterium sp. MCBD17_013]
MAFTRSDLPDDFVIGTATAAYQVEGSVDVDGRGPSIWDDFARVPGAITDGSTGDPADDHLRRYREDVAIMADLGVDAYRFSVAWPRVQADGTGPANQAGLDHYRRLAESLLERGITPWATLYHWDLPSALEARGGWLERDTADRFAEYAGLVVAGLGDLVDHWITLNEPWCSAFLGYASGVHAPGKQLGTRAAHAAHHLMLGHGRAVPAIRAAARPTAQVGVTLNLYSVRSATDSADDRDAARRIDGLQNRLFLEPLLLGHYPEDVVRDLGEQDWFAANPESDAAEIAADVDFVGVNYYSRHTVRAGGGTGAATNAGGAVGAVSANPGSEFVETVDTGAPRTQMGWEIHPDGLVDVLRMVHTLRPELPIAVTENGAAYEDVVDETGAIEDEERRAYVEAHLAACADAVREGIPLRGYFCWSLLDNWEWAFGYTRRFGIVHVDYATQQRTVKRSGRWLAGVLGGPLATTTEQSGAQA